MSEILLLSPVLKLSGESLKVGSCDYNGYDSRLAQRMSGYGQHIQHLAALLDLTK